MHDIDARHRLGHGVLDLETRVGFDEGEAPGLVARDVEEELERAGVGVVNARCELHRSVEDGGAHGLVELGCRRDLDDLLVAALDAAFAFAEVGDGAGAVAEDLHLDVAGARHELLDVEVAVAEGSLRLRRTALERRGDLGRLGDSARAAPTTAGDGLDHHRAAVEPREELARLLDGDGAVEAAQRRDAGSGRSRAGAALIAEQAKLFGCRADEDQPRLGAAARELGALREEPVAGMHGVAARLARDSTSRSMSR